MPDRPGIVAAYAAGASLAAITLFYVFGPNFTIDSGGSATHSDRKKAIVGLSNPANDCFVNSILQALAGLGELRLYLIRELHRREIDGPEIYNLLPGLDEMPRGQKPDQIRELQQGTVTQALKEMLDRLNERPIYKKTISARPFIQALEYAFRTRISRNQQDAQEFLQVVSERLCDEYHAGIRARQRAKRAIQMRAGLGASTAPQPTLDAEAKMALCSKDTPNVAVKIGVRPGQGLPAVLETRLMDIDRGYEFPFEGQLESQIECQFCRYQYRPNKTSFVNLTLQVPQTGAATLSSCFDGLLKTEYIDDFRCDRCRLQHALEMKITSQAGAHSEIAVKQLEVEISRIRDALNANPEQTLEGVTLPPSDLAPKRRIARHMRITVFPKIIAIHLSRSIFDRSSSTKNAARVSFPERLSLGGILDRKWYKLLGIVCHKGSHNSGHYESFRRSHLYPPFSTPDAFRSYAQSRIVSENPSGAPSPSIGSMKRPREPEPSPLNISPATSSPSLSSASSRSPAPSISISTHPPSTTTQLTSPLSQPRPGSVSSPRSSLQSQRSYASPSLPQPPLPAVPMMPSPSDRNPSSSLLRTSKSVSSISVSPRSLADPPTTLSRRRRKPPDRWWRISDEKIKECKTSDVLAMQREVYLLFYEMERHDARSVPSDGGSML